MKPLNTNFSLRDINEKNFDDVAVLLFHHQYKNNQLYQRYVNQIGKDAAAIHRIEDIPFLPIRFFKTHSVMCGDWTPEIVFTSSATTGGTVSKHYIPNIKNYLDNATYLFEECYGALSNFHFLALLPSYIERKGSSLIAMIDHFISQDWSGHSGYYLNNIETLIAKIIQLKNSQKKTIVWGVSFALLDLAEKFEVDLSHCIVMETGGMKGRRKEWVRAELHDLLCKRFNVTQIHSEYGMTELMSQAYSMGHAYFKCPHTMKVLVRDINDPFGRVKTGSVGGINAIDLANIYSCAFIETEDLGNLHENQTFEILGRIDHSDVRGCNLMVH